MNPDQLLLPPSARLVHIGPHKTGTTSLQRAFHVCRDDVARHGVHYAGPTRQPMWAAVAVAGGRVRAGDRPPKPEDWTELLDEIRAAGDQRVILSSEFLCYADEAAARRVVTEVPGGPVHVVITLRPLAKVTPSQWQQYVQNGLRTPFPEWLEGIFHDPPDESVSPSFWRRHDHAALVRRWAEVAGPDNLTVVVADESDPTMLLRTFEAFVGLPQGLVTPQQSGVNRSLTAGEVEMVRLINQHFEDHRWSGDWSGTVHADLMREGALKRMKLGRRPAPGEARVAMPRWALERAAQVGEQTVEAATSLGVRVVGDLATIAQVPNLPEDGADPAMPTHVRADAAALAVFGAITGRDQRTQANRTAGMTAVAGALAGCAPQTDQTGMPLMPVEVAAGAVVGAIEARGLRSELGGLPSIPAGVARLAAHAAARASGASGVPREGDATKVADSLGLKRKGTKRAASRRSTDAEVGDVPPGLSPSEVQVVREVAARDLLEVVARRARRRVRRRLRR